MSEKLFQPIPVGREWGICEGLEEKLAAIRQDLEPIQDPAVLNRWTEAVKIVSCLNQMVGNLDGRVRDLHRRVKAYEEIFNMIKERAKEAGEQAEQQEGTNT